MHLNKQYLPQVYFIDTTAGQQLSGKSDEHFEVTTNEELTCHLDDCVYVLSGNGELNKE